MIIHVMKNGEIRESVEGIVIELPDFYKVLNRIQRKKNNT